MSFAVMEVGMHRAVQCIEAAQHFEAHCVEPSPVSFKRCQKGVKRAAPEVQERIHLHNVAASSTSGVIVDFSATGSTGDSVGSQGIDAWTMTKEKGTTTTSAGKGKTVKVRTSTLDDLISENIAPGTEVLVAKIDVQGFEPHVFQGLADSI